MDRKDPPHPERRSRREQAGDATRAALIEASRALFASRGYADVSIEDITAATGVTRGALYHHFEDKRALFLAVVEAVERDLTEGVREQARRAADPWARLEAACAAYLDACLSREVQRIVVLDAAPVLGWRAWCELDKRHGLGVVEELLAGARDAGLVPGDALETSAQLLLGALNTGARVVADAADQAASRREVGRTVGRILSGLRAPRGRGSAGSP